MGWLYGTVLLLSLIGAMAGYLFRQSLGSVGAGLVAGALLGLRVSLKDISRFMFPDSFTVYESEAEVIEKETVVLSLTIEGVSTSIRGLSKEEWHTLARGVVERGYRYTVRDLQDIFGNQATGSAVYGRVTQQLIDCGVLIQGNGVTVTEHIGRHFFEQLDKRDYKILSLLTPSPVSESV